MARAVMTLFKHAGVAVTTFVPTRAILLLALCAIPTDTRATPRSVTEPLAPEYALTLDFSQGQGLETKTLLLPISNVLTMERGPVPLGMVKLGEHVLLEGDATSGVVTNVHPHTPRPARAGAQRILGVFKRTTSTLLLVQTGTETLTTTPEHPFWVIDKGWVAAGQLRNGDRVDAKTPLGYATILSIETKPASNIPVYNFHVEGTHTYRVGKEGLLVHNGCGFSRPTPEPGPPAPLPGAPTTSPFRGDNTADHGTPTRFVPRPPVRSGPAHIDESSAEGVRGTEAHVGVDLITDNANDNGNGNRNPNANAGYYLHWTENGQESVTLDNRYNRFATAALSGCAVRIETDPTTGLVTVTHYNRQRPGDDDLATFGHQYDDFAAGDGHDVGVNHDSNNPNVQWILPGRDYVGISVLTGERNPAGQWVFSLRPRA